MKMICIKYKNIRRASHSKEYDAIRCCFSLISIPIDNETFEEMFTIQNHVQAFVLLLFGCENIFM